MPTEDDHVLDARDLLVDGGVLAGDADELTDDVRLPDDVVAEDAGAAAVRLQERREHGDGRRLAGAVRGRGRPYTMPGSTWRSTPSTA